jgi:hypothetical protein
VFLPIEQTGWAKCGYCGAEYTLVREGGRVTHTYEAPPVIQTR